MPGSACTSEAAECVTASSLGICDKAAGKWFEQPCVGRCSNTQATQCEKPLAKVGDPCMLQGEGGFDCASESSLVQCVNQKFIASDRACPKCARRPDIGSITCT